jgi:hypothetical protein
MGGIFSSRERTYAFTAIQRMSEDADIIPSSKIAMLHYLAASANSPSVSVNDKSLAQYLMEYSQKSLPSRCRRAYNFAYRGRYAYGLPTTNEATVAGVNLSNKIKAFLDDTTGHTVSMVYANIGDQNYQHFMWKKLIEVYGYNPTTNELVTFSNSEGFPCYLQTGKLIFGYQTVVSTESGEALDQYGYSTESGACLARSQDLNALAVTPDVNTDTPDAIAEVFYQYSEIVPDVTPPHNPTVNNLSTTMIDGYAERSSDIKIYVNTVLKTTLTADSLGYFNYTFGTPLLTGDIVRLVVRDASSNESSGSDTVVPYTNSSPEIIGEYPAPTTITRTKSFTFDFLDYIPSAVPQLPSEADQPPTVITGSGEFVQEYDYIQACYTYTVGAVTHIEYLTYEYGSGTQPALDALFTFTPAAGEFYPRLYARLNGQELPNTLGKNSNEYKSSKELGKILGIDWFAWSANLHSSIAENMPLSELQEVFLTIAAPMNTTDAVIIEYQYHYWTKMFNELTGTVTTGTLAGTGAKVGKVLTIADTTYTNTINFSAVNIVTVTGTIGAVGTYNSDYVNASRSWAQTQYVPNSGGTQYSYPTAHPSCHVYRYQDTLTTYKEVRVYSAKSNHAFLWFSTLAVGTDENLVIPLDRTALPNLSGVETEILFNKCLYLVMNMTKVVKTRWYQRGVFKAVMVIVAVVITVFTAGAGASLLVILTDLAVNLAIATVINIIITALVKTGAISGKFAAALAVVATILAAVNGYFDTSLLNLSATQLLGVAAVCFDISTKTTQFDFKHLEREASAFSLEVQEKNKALQQARALLGNPVVPMELELLLSDSRSKVFIALGESPDDFMAKGSMNSIETLQGFVSNYVEIMMQPPSLQQLLNQTQRGNSDGLSTI